MIARPNAALAQIHTQIMWNRLIAVVEEQAQTMIRTAFSTSVREAGDLSAGVFDRQGRMLAQAVTGTPGHVNSMANGVKHFLDVYPIDGMKPGDHYITNDPWLTSGHLHDITVVTPSFYRGEAVGLVRQHHPCRRYRRARHGAGRPAGVRGRRRHSDHEARPRGPHERGFVAPGARQCARAAAGRGRHLCLRGVQRRGQPAPDRDDAGVRASPISTGSATASSKPRARRPWRAFASCRKAPIATA